MVFTLGKADQLYVNNNWVDNEETRHAKIEQLNFIS